MSTPVDGVASPPMEGSRWRSRDSFSDVELGPLALGKCALCGVPQEGEVLVPACNCQCCTQVLVHALCLTKHRRVTGKACVRDCGCRPSPKRSRTLLKTRTLVSGLTQRLSKPHLPSMSSFGESTKQLGPSEGLGAEGVAVGERRRHTVDAVTTGGSGSLGDTAGSGHEATSPSTDQRRMPAGTITRSRSARGASFTTPHRTPAHNRARSTSMPRAPNLLTPHAALGDPSSPETANLSPPMSGPLRTPPHSVPRQRAGDKGQTAMHVQEGEGTWEGGMWRSRSSMEVQAGHWDTGRLERRVASHKDLRRVGEDEEEGDEAAFIQALRGLTVSELQHERRQMQLGLAQWSTEMIRQLQRQDELRREADRLLILAHKMSREAVTSVEHGAAKR